MKRENIIIGLLIFLFTISILLSFGKNFKSEQHSATNLMIANKAIALIYLDGPISASSASSFMDPAGIDATVDELQRIEEDRNIKAVVIRINSPGGTSGASQELYNEILKFKARTKLPVIISIADIGASGAYWVALAGDRIFANPSSLVGSIGVIMSNFDLTEISKKYGVGMNTVKSAEYKDILSSWRKITPKENELLQALVLDVHSQFVQEVAKARKLDLPTTQALADGRVFTGAQAQKLKLIDELGGLQDAIEYAQKAANLKQKPKIVVKNKNPMYQFLDFFKTQSQAKILEETLAKNSINAPN